MEPQCYSTCIFSPSKQPYNQLQTTPLQVLKLSYLKSGCWGMSELRTMPAACICCFILWQGIDSPLTSNAIWYSTLWNIVALLPNWCGVCLLQATRFVPFLTHKPCLCPLRTWNWFLFSCCFPRTLVFILSNWVRGVVTKSLIDFLLLYSQCEYSWPTSVIN